MHVEHSCGPISHLGIPSPQGHSRSAGPRNRAELGGKLQLWGLQTRSVGPGSRTICISPGSSQTVHWSPEHRLSAGLWSSRRDPAREDARVTTPHGLASNSPTPGLRKAPAGGAAAEERAAPSRPERGKRSASGRCRAQSTRKSREKAATRGAQRAAADPQEGGAGRAARRGPGAVGATAIPPVAAVLWPSPAPRLASGGSAAELERGRHRGRFSSRSCCRRRADGRTRGAGGGAANPAGRGGADRPR